MQRMRVFLFYQRTFRKIGNRIIRAHNLERAGRSETNFLRADANFHITLPLPLGRVAYFAVDLRR